MNMSGNTEPCLTRNTQELLILWRVPSQIRSANRPWPWSGAKYHWTGCRWSPTCTCERTAACMEQPQPLPTATGQA